MDERLKRNWWIPPRNGEVVIAFLFQALLCMCVLNFPHTRQLVLISARSEIPIAMSSQIDGSVFSFNVYDSKAALRCTAAQFKIENFRVYSL